MAAAVSVFRNRKITTITGLPSTSTNSRSRTHCQTAVRDASPQDTSTLRQPGAQSISPVVNVNGSGRPTASGLTKFERTMITLRLQTSGRIPLKERCYPSLSTRLYDDDDNESQDQLLLAYPRRETENFIRHSNRTRNMGEQVEVTTLRFQNTIRPSTLTVA